jgi:hypothetical protein
MAVPILPPLTGISILDTEGRLTSVGINLFQQIWTAAFGSGSAAPNLLGYSDAINFGVTGDTAITLSLPTKAIGWRSALGMVFGTSGSFTAAKAGLYSAASQQGTVLVGQTALSNITATGFNAASTITDLNPNPTAIWTYSTIYLNVGTAQGGTSLGNFYLYGYPVF